MKPLLSIIVPVYNEEQMLPLFHKRISAVLDKIQGTSEIIYINDGSRDTSIKLMHNLQQQDPRVTILDLSRNFGKEIAMSAGLDHAQGDAVIIIDADLQDPPELISRFVKEWQQGYDVVYGQRLERDGESAFKKFTAYAFYRVIRSISKIDIPIDTGDFRLLNRRAVDALKLFREQNRFMKGMFSWIGFKQKAVRYNRDPRQAGTTKWNYWRLWNFAIEGITSYTEAPLKVSSYLGLLIAALAFIYGAIIIAKTLFFGEPVRGYASLMTVILFLGGVQLMALGIIGEYLGRMFMESKNRPLYLVNLYAPSKLIDSNSPSKQDHS